MKKLLNLFKTLYVNLRYLPLGQAVRLPIYCRWNVRIRIRRGDLVLPEQPGRFSVRLGQEGLHPCQNPIPSLLYIRGGRLVIRGSVTLCQGFFVRVLEGARLELGEGFYASDRLDLACTQAITTGKGTIVGYDVTIRDSDGHPVWVQGVQRPDRRELTLGQHNWIGAKVIILKGGSLGDGNIVAAGACVSRSFEDTHHCAIGGNPAGILRENVAWER